MMETTTRGRLGAVWDFARGLGLLVLFALLGIGVARISPIPFPPPLIGLGLMGVALKMGLVRLAWIENAGLWLLKHMSLFFLPILLGATRQIPDSPGARIAVALATFGGTSLTFWVTQNLCERWMPRGEEAATP